MARLPDPLPLVGEDAPGLPAVAVAPTDFGLGEAGQALGVAADAGFSMNLRKVRAGVVADRQTVAPDVVAARERMATQFAADLPSWNGQPGFASDQVTKAQKVVADLAANPKYTPGQRAEFLRSGNMAVAEFGNTVVGHEAAQLTQNAVDRQQVVSNGALTNFTADYSPKKQALLDGYDGSQSGLTKSVLDAFDTSAQAAVAAAPTLLQPGLQAHFAAMRAQEAADTSGLEQKGQDAFVLRNAGDQASTLINTVSSNPSAYDNVVAQIPSIVATMPAGLRKDAQRELVGMAARARVNALIEGNAPGQAVTELNDGRYDAVITPEIKQELEARAQAQNRARGPAAITTAMAGEDLQHRMAADTYARLTTGQTTTLKDAEVQAGLASGAISAEVAGRWAYNARLADQTFAAIGPTHELSANQLAAMGAEPPPAPSDPQYADKLPLWQAKIEAAQAELKARDQPGAWAFAGGPAGARGAAGAGAAQDSGAQLRGLYAAAQQPGPGQVGAWRSYANTMLGVQQHSGIPAATRQIVPQAEADRLAASVANAPPEGRMQAMQALAAYVSAMPASVALPNGELASPRAMLTRQLEWAHLTPVELSAAMDFGDKPAALGRVVAALNDPTLGKALDHSQETQLKASVKIATAAYLATVSALPGAGDLAQARIDRTALVARRLMVAQNMSASDAARTAAGDMSAGYRFVDSYRVPASIPGGDVGAIRAGAGWVMARLVAHDGQALFAPAGIDPDPAAARRKFAQQVQHSARWVTAPDDSGLMLGVPKPDGSWTQVGDRFGRGVYLNWTQLQAQGRGKFDAPSPFAAPPPDVAHAPDGKPLAALSRTQALSALGFAITGRESNWRNGLLGAPTSTGRAHGLMQLMPETVATYAPRLGLPVDMNRAQNDADYNQRIGYANINDLLGRYGSSGAGLALTLAGYAGGPGRVEGYRDAGGYHPGWLATLGDPRKGQISPQAWIDRIPKKETREYLQALWPKVVAHLQAQG